MKRLLGLIGLSYLSSLAVVFYFYSDVLLLCVIAGSVVLIAVGLFLKIIKAKYRIKSTLIVSGISVLCACISLIFYTNFIYLPVIENYSDKEITVNGYICEEIQKSEGSCTYIISTDKVNGESADIKIRLISYSDLRVEEFERIKAKLHIYKTDNDNLLSKGIFFTAYTDDEFSIERTGEKQFSLYAYAVDARKAMKTSLDTLLPEDYSSLCRAVLLGDKQALTYDVRSNFTNTGTSFLIVVSGMHLSIITSFILFILKKFTKNRIVLCVFVCITVLSFMAVTGFAPSVIRSGVMLILTYCSTVVLRKSDSLNSIGAAAIVLTVLNPYAVGDIGMILSFVATLGIILWSNKVNSFIVKKLKLKSKIMKAAANLIAVSVSASIWIIPVTTIAFGRISPLVVFVSFFAEPLVSIILICAMLSSVLFLCPLISFLAYPFALAAGLVSRLFLWIISVFASVPYCSVNSDKIYFYVWLAVTILLVFTGYAVRAKSFYIKCSIAFSLITLMLGWAVYTFIDYNTTTLNVYNTDSGTTASVECGYNITLLSCGGYSGKSDDVIEDISDDFVNIDNIIIPNQKNKYSRYLPRFINEFDVSNVLVYDKNSVNQKILQNYDGQSRNTFGDNVHFTLNITAHTTDDVLNIDGVTYQLVRSDKRTLLFIPDGGDAAGLPKIYRTADYLMIDSIPDNCELLKCNTIIFTGSREQYTRKLNSLKEISEKIYFAQNGKVSIEI